jgi:hypothetical protein
MAPSTAGNWHGGRCLLNDRFSVNNKVPGWTRQYVTHVHLVGDSKRSRAGPREVVCPSKGSLRKLTGKAAFRENSPQIVLSVKGRQCTGLSFSALSRPPPPPSRRRPRSARPPPVRPLSDFPFSQRNSALSSLSSTGSGAGTVMTRKAAGILVSKCSCGVVQHVDGVG